MTEWNEETFLEKLMPSMQQQRRVAQNGCPDVDLLCALSDDRLSGEVKAATTAHLAGCSRCNELYSRLINFATPGVHEDEQEWTNAEKRLEIWTEGFLRSAQSSRSTALTGLRIAASAEPVRWWTPWKIGFSLGAAGAALAAVTIALLLLPRSAQRAVQTAQTIPTTQSTSTPPPTSPAPPENAPAVSTAAQPTADTPPAQQPQPQEMQSPGLSTVAPKPKAPAAPKPNQKKSVPPARSGAEAAKEPIVVAESQPSSSNEISSDTSATVTRGSMRVAPPTAAPAPQQSASALPTVPPAHAMATEKPADLRSYPRTTVPSLPNATLRAPVPVLPASFRLEAGTRLWIRLTSLSRQPDGNVQFAGTLLEPVTQPGMPRLERGTAISGFEVQKQNVTSLVITTFNVGTVRYRLKGATATATIPASSSSKTLQFDKGQVLETFIDAPAIYEKASGNSQPQR